MTSRFPAATNGVDPEASRQSELARILDGYLAAVEHGQAVDPAALAAAHPEIADRLRACLSVLRLAGRVEGRTDTDAAFEPAADTRLGDFRIIRMIGRGGMGIVFEAEQISLRRRVALKVLPFAAALDPQPLRRFQIEAQATAQLHHTNIVPIFSVGSERGVHYYAMQYIEGQTLATLVRDLRRLAGWEAPPADESTAAGASLAGEMVSGRLDPHTLAGRESPDTALRPTRGLRSRGDSTRTPAYFRTVAHLGLQAAEALDYAHRLGIIHRDIKPANLLVDVRGNLWVTDFGLARMQADAGLTMTGDMIGTLRYMSPEQSAARREIVDHRADVYSLGATLYELLTLHPAHDGRDRAELLHQMAFREPRGPRSYNPSIPRDLETIVLKALTKDVGHRYATARDMADDLRRFLDHRPIQARRPSLWRRAEKWGRRHKPLVASALLILTILAVSATVVATLARKNQRLDRIARHAQYVHDVRQAFQLVRQNDFPEAVRILDRHRPGPGGEDDRSFPWYYLWRLCHFRPGTLAGHERAVYHVEFSPDGRTLASCGRDGTIRLWDAPTGRPLQVLRGHEGDVNYVAFSPDGRMLATGGDDGTVRLWDAAGGGLVSVLGKHADWVTCVLFSPDGRRLISGARDNQVKVWEIDTRRELASFSPGWRIEGMALSPDGRTLVTGGWDHSVPVWDLANARVRLSLQTGSRAQCVAFSHDGRIIATAHTGPDRAVRVWDAGSGRLKATLRGHAGGIESVAFSPDDRLLASSAGDGTIRLWEADTGRLQKVYRGHHDRVWCVGFSPDGHTLASCGQDSRVNLWDLSTAQDRIPVRLPGVLVQSLAFSPAGRRATVFSSDETGGMMTTFDQDRGDILDRRRIRTPTRFINGAFSPDGETLATATPDERVTLWEVASALPRLTFSIGPIESVAPHPGQGAMEQLAFSPDGRTLAIARPEHGLISWTDETGVQRRFPRFDGGAPWISMTNGAILVCNLDTLGRGNLETGEFGPTRPRGEHQFLCTAFSRDGRSAATGMGGGMIKLWDADALREQPGLLGHTGDVTSLAWSPDDRVLASRSDDGTVRLWDVATRQELGTIEESGAGDWTLMFSPDGTTLAGYGGTPHEVILWPAPREESPGR